MRLFVPVLAALLLLASPGFAAEPEEKAASEGYRAADQELNQTYQQVRAKLTRPVQAKLVTAQLAWIAFRDAESTFHADRMRGRAGAGALADNTRATLTVQRTASLEGLAEMVMLETEAGPSDVRPNPASQLEAAKMQLRTADQALNARYKQVLNAVDAPAKKLLVTAELKWIAFRDADAAVWAAVRPTPEYASDRIFALGSSTEQRADNLKALLARLAAKARP